MLLSRIKKMTIKEFRSEIKFHACTWLSKIFTLFSVKERVDSLHNRNTCKDFDANKKGMQRILSQIGSSLWDHRIPSKCYIYFRHIPCGPTIVILKSLFSASFSISLFRAMLALWCALADVRC